MTETRGLAETQCFGDLIDRQLVLTQHLLGLLEPQLIKQFLIAAAQILQVPTQGARRAIHLFGQTFEAGRRIQLRAE